VFAKIARDAQRATIGGASSGSMEMPDNDVAARWYFGGIERRTTSGDGELKAAGVAAQPQ
jgi:hypothetical protein